MTIPFASGAREQGIRRRVGVQQAAIEQAPEDILTLVPAIEPVAVLVEGDAQTAGALFVSSVRYDGAVTQAMVRGGSIVHGHNDGQRQGAAADLVTLWQRTAAALDRCERDRHERLGR